MRKPVTIVLLAGIVVLLTSFGLKEQVARSRKKHFAKAPYDVVIVPGYPYYETNPPYPLLTCRMNWAKALYDSGVAKNFIFSGGAIHTPYNEARVMKIISDTLGKPQDHNF